jgi:ATP-binding cassette subfamily F protein uup
VSTTILDLDGSPEKTGKAQFFADSAQWEESRKAAAAPPKSAGKSKTGPAKAAKKLSYKEQKEWEGMEVAIGRAEAALAASQAAVEDPAVATDPAALQARYTALEAARAAVERLYARWAELEAKAAS